MINLCRVALVAAVLNLAGQAYALPAYAKKENKNCAYCHNNPKGAGKRTLAGEWYKSHGRSLKGFKEPAKPAPKKK